MSKHSNVGRHCYENPHRRRTMCPICLTTATVVAASTTSGAGVLGLVAVRARAWRWLRRCWPARSR